MGEKGYNHRARSAGAGRTAPLFWLSVLGLGTAGLAGLSWGAPRVLPPADTIVVAQAEKPLRPAFQLPRLTVSTGGPERTVEMPPPPAPLPSVPSQDVCVPEPMPAPPKVEVTPPPPETKEPEPPLAPPPIPSAPPIAVPPTVQLPEPPAPAPQPAFEPPAPLAPLAPIASAPDPFEACSDPVVYLHPCGLQPGESPMIRTWKTLALYGLLAAAAAPAPAPAQEKDTFRDDLAKIARRIDQIEQRLTTLSARKTPEDLDRLGKRLDLLEKDQKDLRALATKGTPSGDSDRLAARLDEIEQTQKELRKLTKVRIASLDVLDQISRRLDQLEMAQKVIRVDATQPSPPTEDRRPAAGVANREILRELKKLESILNQLQDLKIGVDSLGADVRGVKKEIGGLKDNVSTLQGEQLKQKLQIDASKGRIELIESQLSALRSEMKAARKRLAELDVAPAPTPDKSAIEEIRLKINALEQAISKATTSARLSMAAPAPTMGRVVLRNLYNERLLFLVNGEEHGVEPGQTVEVRNVPAGALTYQVISPTWGDRGREVRTLAANETFTVTAR